MQVGTAVASSGSGGNALRCAGTAFGEVERRRPRSSGQVASELEKVEL